MIRQIGLHGLLWALYTLVEWVTNLPHYSNHAELLRQTLFFLPVIALPFYFIAYYLVPRFLWTGRRRTFWLACAGVLLLVLFLRMEWSYWYGVLEYGQGQYLPMSKISKNLFRDYAVIGFAVSLRIIKDWEEKDRLTIRLQDEKRDAELQFLRAQIHPHFLFNTLNNLYGLALKGSPHTADSILRLSGLLDFILYECNTERISLQKEVLLIQHYIELERLRFGKRLDLSFKHNGPIKQVSIAPLLLLPFVENAFKHGVAAKNNLVFVNIEMTVNGTALEFRVENSINAAAGQPEGAGRGIGLRNVEKRLQLLYPGAYKLEQTVQPEVFSTLLKLSL